MTTTEFETDLGEIGSRWTKRAAKEMRTHHITLHSWLDAQDYERIAAFIISAATTGKGD